MLKYPPTYSTDIIGFLSIDWYFTNRIVSVFWQRRPFITIGKDNSWWNASRGFDRRVSFKFTQTREIDLYHGDEWLEWQKLDDSGYYTGGDRRSPRRIDFGFRSRSPNPDIVISSSMQADSFLIQTVRATCKSPLPIWTFVLRWKWSCRSMYFVYDIKVDGSRRFRVG